MILVDQELALGALGITMSLGVKGMRREHLLHVISNPDMEVAGVGSPLLAEIRRLPSDITIVACLQGNLQDSLRDSLQESNDDDDDSGDGTPTGLYTVWAVSVAALIDEVAEQDAALAKLLLEPRYAKHGGDCTAAIGLTEHRGRPRAYDSSGKPRSYDSSEPGFMNRVRVLAHPAELNILTTLETTATDAASGSANGGASALPELRYHPAELDTLSAAEQGQIEVVAELGFTLDDSAAMFLACGKDAGRAEEFLFAGRVACAISEASHSVVGAAKHDDALALLQTLVDSQSVPWHRIDLRNGDVLIADNTVLLSSVPPGRGIETPGAASVADRPPGAGPVADRPVGVYDELEALRSCAESRAAARQAPAGGVAVARITGSPTRSHALWAGLRLERGPLKWWWW